MKSINTYYFDGEPSKTTHRFTLTKQLSANANLSSHFSYEIHRKHNLFEDLEEEEAIIESMEHADGLAA